ncbi:PAS domain-containing protein [Enterobacter bugandensis]|uniref:PAS domain-containing protein n=1 Tax=Enterobacter bugandensis TaxID=881260 RepID=UPI002A816344|nr:PAS domain-containing protein [Enterobacter bugandensis]
MSDIVIPEMLTRSLDLLPDPYCIQTHDGLFLYANLSAAKLAGMRSANELRDRFYHEIPSPLFEEATLNDWQMQDKKIVESRKSLTMLEVHPDAVDSPYTIRKVPFYNNDNQCIGVFCSVKYFEVFSPNDFIRGKLPGSLLLNKPDDTFTERECEIAFFRLQGISSKEIGSILCLSPRTIECRLSGMYMKAGVNHLDDFKHFCETRNLHRYLPKRLLSRKIVGFVGDYTEDSDD